MARSGPVTKNSSTIAVGLAQIRVGNSAANIATGIAALSSADSIGALANSKYTGGVEIYEFKSGFPLKKDLSIVTGESVSIEGTFNEITPYNLALAHGLDPSADVDATATEEDTVSTAGTTTGVITVDNNGGVLTERFTIVFTGATAYSVYGSVSGHIADCADLTSEFAPVDGSSHAYFTIPANFFSGTWAADDTFVFSTSEYVSGTSAFANAHSGEIGLGARATPEYIRMEAVYTYPNGVNTMTFIFPRAQAVSTVEVDLQQEEAAGVPITFEATPADSEVSGGNAVWDSKPMGVILFA